MANELTRWIRRAWRRCRAARYEQQPAVRARFERLEPRTVLSASYLEISIELLASSISFPEDNQTGGSQVAFLDPTDSQGWTSAYESAEDRRAPQLRRDDQLLYEWGTDFDSDKKSLVVAISILTDSSRRGVFRVSPLPPPPPPATMYGVPDTMINTFPEDDPPRHSNSTGGDLQQRLQAEGRSPNSFEPFGPFITPATHHIPSTGGVTSREPQIGPIVGDLSVHDDQASVDNTDSASATTARDAAFEDHDSQPLLLAASLGPIENSNVDETVAEFNYEPFDGTEQHIQFDGISAIGKNALAEYRLASQRAATDDVLRNLRAIGVTGRDSTVSAPIGSSPEGDVPFALDARTAAHRSHADGDLDDVTHNAAVEGGMILLAATGDANEGVSEPLANSDMNDVLILPIGMDPPVGDRQALEMATQAGVPIGSNESAARVEATSAPVTDQPGTSPSSRPSQQQAAMLVGTGVVLGAVRWRRKKRTRKDR